MSHHLRHPHLKGGLPSNEPRVGTDPAAGVAASGVSTRSVVAKSPSRDAREMREAIINRVGSVFWLRNTSIDERQSFACAATTLADRGNGLSERKPYDAEEGLGNRQLCTNLAEISATAMIRSNGTRRITITHDADDYKQLCSLIHSFDAWRPL